MLPVTIITNKIKIVVYVFNNMYNHLIPITISVCADFDVIFRLIFSSTYFDLVRTATNTATMMSIDVGTEMANVRYTSLLYSSSGIQNTGSHNC